MPDMIETPILNTRIIALEGLDGTGKSTLIKNLEKHLREQGKSVYVLRLPDYQTKEGERTFKLAVAAMAEGNLSVSLNYMLENTFYVVSEILSKMFGKVDYILMDRFIASSYVYQSVIFTPKWKKIVQSVNGADLNALTEEQDRLHLDTISRYQHQLSLFGDSIEYLWLHADFDTRKRNLFKDLNENTSTSAQRQTQPSVLSQFDTISLTNHHALNYLYEHYFSVTMEHLPFRYRYNVLFIDTKMNIQDVTKGAIDLILN